MTFVLVDDELSQEYKKQCFKEEGGEVWWSLTVPFPLPRPHESGIWSTISSNGESDTGSISNRSKKGKKTESPFESRPKLARTNSFSKKKPELSSLRTQGSAVLATRGSSG
uniref:Uncharacterized protein n=1 Tax=Magallana gigas TaxID=29159 RepID=A0A8W8HWW1_MAGGI|nr:uncharacterized protein LOC117688944 [Crassostrea gigas]